MNRLTPDKKFLVEQYNLGYSMEDIGKMLNMSTGKIFKYFKIYEIDVRKNNLESPIAKKRWLKSREGIPSPNKGKKLTDETKRKISQAHYKGGIGHKKKRSDGYIAVYFPDHPKSFKDGYIMEHDLIMSCYIGRWLNDNEVVHHKNHIKDDNRITNLQLLTASEHTRLHSLERHQKRRDDLSTKQF